MKPVRGNPVRGLVGATIGFFTGFAAVSLFGPTVKFLEEAAGLTPVLAGLLISIPSLSGSLLRIPFSAMVDTTGGRTPFIILLSLSATGVLGVFLLVSQGAEFAAAQFPLLLLFGTLGGCGIATFSVGISQTSYWFPLAKQGSALGTYAGAGNLAPGIFAWFLSAVAVPYFGLGGSYLVWLVILLVGLAAYIVFGRNSPYFQLIRGGMSRDEALEEARSRYGQELFPKRKVSESLRASAAIRQTWGLVFIYFTTFGGFLSLTAWFTNYWESYFALDLARAGMLTAIFSITASLFRIAGGRIADVLGGEKTASGSLLLILAGASVLSFSTSVPLSITGMLFTALGMGVGNAAVFKLVPQYVPEAVGGASGWVGGLGAFGGFVIPIVLGLAAGTGEAGNPGYARGFLVLVVLGALSLAVIPLLRSRKRAG